MHECESIELEKIKESVNAEKNGYFVLNEKIEMCEPNGWFARVQKLKDKYLNIVQKKIANCLNFNKILLFTWVFFNFIFNRKVCVDKYGGQIENFQVDITSPLAKTMNCSRF